MRRADVTDYQDDQALIAEPIMLTKQQAAMLAQVGLGTLQNWLDEPGFPAIRTPRQVRIHAQLFNEWLAKKAGGDQ